MDLWRNLPRFLILLNTSVKAKEGSINIDHLFILLLNFLYIRFVFFYYLQITSLWTRQYHSSGLAHSWTNVD